MREIKFRAWDNRRTKMWHSDSQDEMELKDDTIGKSLLGIFFEHCSNTTTMQYTGLKDRNGREVYEGDIVKVTDWPTSHYEVKWDRGYWEIFRIASDGKPLSSMLIDVVEGTHCEIIGNVFENPGLALWRTK